MSLKMLTKVAPDVSDSVLGTLLVGMLDDGEMSVGSFGSLARVGLGSGSGNVPAECCGGDAGYAPVDLALDVPAGDAMIKADLPLNHTDRKPFEKLLYASFTKFFVRSVSALSDITGLTENGVLALVLDNNDFEVISNRNTGAKMISTSEEVLGARADKIIYASFETFRRRSLGALARLTGLTEEFVRDIVETNSDFRVSGGRDTDRTFVSVRGL